MSHEMLKVSLVKGLSGVLRLHRESVRGLGLRRRGQTVYVRNTPENQGMIRKVSYLLKVEGAEDVAQ